MKTKNVLTLLFVVILAASVLVSCGSRVNVVNEVPVGFVKLSTAEDNHDNGGLHYTIGESQISFFDADEICIYQSKLINTDFIVKCERNYYINEDKYSTLVDQAETIAEQRNRIYGDGPVYLRTKGTLFAIILFDVVKSYSSDGKTLCNLEFAKSVEGDCVYSYETDIMKQIFDHVETNKGTIIDDFSIANGVIQVEIPDGEELNLVAVKSPDYPGCVRKISGSARGYSLLSYPPMN